MIYIDELQISNNIDIYVQLQYNPQNFIVVGEVKESISDFVSATNSIYLIKKLPTDHIVRHIIKVIFIF